MFLRYAYKKGIHLDHEKVGAKIISLLPVNGEKKVVESKNCLTITLIIFIKIDKKLFLLSC